MKEKIITFETAKLAKEKGFNEICEYGYFDRDDEIILDISDHNNSDNLDISAPTQALLQKWLREKQNIHNKIHSYNSDRVGYEIYKMIIRDTCNDYFKHINDTKALNSYEEALEKGLIEALKIVK